MRLKKLIEGIELPEKASATRYINVRANERIDVCYGDYTTVATGVHVTVAKNETARVEGENVVHLPVVTGELFITMHNQNPDGRNIMIYPSQVLAEIWVEKAPVKTKSSRSKTTKIVSRARLVDKKIL